MRASRMRQRGVAVITALLLTTLAVTIVASLFWSQQVQIRAMENQRIQMQSKWVLRGMLDWARRVLREDARVSSVDHLGEAWAVPMDKRQLADYVEREPSAGAGALRMSASISDAQARFNLANLAQNAVVDLKQLAIFKRLLASVQLDPALANAALAEVLATESLEPAAPLPGAAAAAPKPAPRARLRQLGDLLQAPGFTPAALAKLERVAVLLPVPSLVNVNTAGPEVLAALMNKSVGEAAAVVAARKAAYFKDEADFFNRAAVAPDMSLYSVRSDFFLVSAGVTFGRGQRDMQALIYRKSTGNTTVKWFREF
jgi:general secretion pathway protein K